MSPWKRDPQTLSERLFLVRNEQGLTWRQVAHLLGVQTLDVAAYEQGDPVPQRVLVTFSAALGVSLDWLLLGTGQRYTPASLRYSVDTLLL